jgi:hypothetical protein
MSGDRRDEERNALAGRAAALIDRLAQGGRDDPERDALLADLARFQARHVAPYRRLLAARGVDPAAVSSPGELPAVPTDVFRFTRVAVHPPELDRRVFRTSGTTSGQRGAHPFRDLALYDRAARAAAGRALFPDGVRLRLIELVAGEDEAPESSLSYMVGRFREWFGDGEGVTAWRDGRLRIDLLAEALDRAVADGRPTALLGTSFALVQAEEELGERRWRLPARSRIMPTGGFKGRSREVEPGALRRGLAARFGVSEAWIVAEYGMTELSSQVYETTLADALAGGAVGPRRLVPPAWMRVSVVDPESLAPLRDGEVGLLRLEDPANLDTAWAVQTSDLARAVPPDGFELLGRAPGATPRGCSLAVEEALGR